MTSREDGELEKQRESGVRVIKSKDGSLVHSGASQSGSCDCKDTNSTLAALTPRGSTRRRCVLILKETYVATVLLYHDFPARFQSSSSTPQTSGLLSHSALPATMRALLSVAAAAATGAAAASDSASVVVTTNVLQKR